MHELRTSNDLLGTPGALRARLDDEGYVFLRDVLDRELLANIKAGMMAWLAAREMVTVSDGEPFWTGRDFTPLGGDPPELFETCLSETLAFTPEMQRWYETVLDEPGWVLPMTHYQFKSPSNSHRSHPHQDGAFTPGLDFATFWIPLTEIPEEVGGITIAPFVHRRGTLYPDGVPEGINLPSGSVADDAWYRADYRPGDLLVFAMYTPHNGIPNSTDRVRLSIDIRVQTGSFMRPVMGVVTDADREHVTIASESGQQTVLGIDEGCFIYSNNYAVEPADPAVYLGQRVMATVGRDNTALLLRRVRGYAPWEQ